MYLLFSLFWPFRSPFFRSMPASKYCFWLQSRAFFAPRAPSAKMSVCIDATILSISYTICCFLCAFHASTTFFNKKNTLFCENMLPALGGKHDFESGTKAKSWNMCLLGPPIMPVCTLFTPLIAAWHLQNPLDKCVFSVYGPFSEATFSIVCFIAWLRSEISTFLHRIWPHIVQKCLPHSVLQKGKLMQHMFR